MYRKDIEAMPREVQEELVKCVQCDSILTDAVVLGEDMISLLGLSDQAIVETLSRSDNFPDFWLVYFEESDCIYLVFESKLTIKQEEMLFDIPEYDTSSFCWDSVSSNYGIY